MAMIIWFKRENKVKIILSIAFLNKKTQDSASNCLQNIYNAEFVKVIFRKYIFKSKTFIYLHLKPSIFLQKKILNNIENKVCRYHHKRVQLQGCDSALWLVTLFSASNGLWRYPALNMLLIRKHSNKSMMQCSQG